MNRTSTKHDFNAVMHQNAEFYIGRNHTSNINSVNDICIAPQHIPKSETYKPKTKIRKEFAT